MSSRTAVFFALQGFFKKVLRQEDDDDNFSDDTDIYAFLAKFVVKQQKKKKKKSVCRPCIPIALRYLLNWGEVFQVSFQNYISLV